MKVTDHDQRVEELQLALSRTFESRKAPAVTVLDEGDSIVFNVSWVVATGRDTTLDSRCSASVVFTSDQLERYAAMATVQRRYVQDRMMQRLRSMFAQMQQAQADPNACSLDLRAEDAWFDAPDPLG